MKKSTYDKFPVVSVPAAYAEECWCGWKDLCERLAGELAARAQAGRASVLAVECYPGVFDDDLREQLAAALGAGTVIDSKQAFRAPEEIERLVAPWLGGDDPIFGRLAPLELEAFFDEKKSDALRARAAEPEAQSESADGGGGERPVLIVGPGALRLAPAGAVVVYADMPRWEGQLRQRRDEVSNLGVVNPRLKASLQYKRSFFVDWRVCDREKRRTMVRWDFLLDTTKADAPKMISGAAHLAGLKQAAARPFRVVPFFDPGPWGGQWMKRVCNLDRTQANYAWCFDCVPEENSLRLGFGKTAVEIPAMNLVLNQPRALLGEAVEARFGAEFPIRFDFLDTMGGGNLSLQVHPTAEYAREHFGLGYTQDESYYLLDAEPQAAVLLGRKHDAERGAMKAALKAAATGAEEFPAEQFAARWPAKKHDHFLIPAGTLHCSGAGCMVLEISATPYIFTFKLWDWGRMGLDGKPRPINLARGDAVLDWSWNEEKTDRQLINAVEEVAEGEGWSEERTGLHASQFIETRRHWFTAPVPHDTGGGVNVLNLVEGAAAVVESPTGAFEPFTVHYAETFIVPAAVGAYTIRPLGEGRHATLKAFVRTGGVA